MTGDETTPASGPQTLYDKIWAAHAVETREDGMTLLYIDRHLIHEVTSPQAFEGLRVAGRSLRRPDLTLAVPDHNVPTTDRAFPVKDKDSALQLKTLRDNCAEFGVEYFEIDAAEQGIVHIIGPEQGFTLPGTTVVCGDSHTSTHGAFGALGFGIGTSEIEHVFATQTLLLKKSRNMAIEVTGSLGFSVTAKDVALAIISQISAAGANGHVMEYRGPVIEALSMEGRMTLCNMSIEAGGRAGLVAPDAKTYAYVEGRRRAPQGAMWEKALRWWKTLPTDPGARFDTTVIVDGSAISPLVTWGTSPEDAIPITARIPEPDSFASKEKQEAARLSLDYMGLKAGTPMEEIAVQHIFIGSCTNSRIEDLRAAAAVVRGRHVANTIKQALVVPGSGLVKRQAEKEGLDRIFLDAGFEWREPGCSMCIAMNPDKVPAGERCASTSNRNFRGRQGRGARTHLLSPAMAAAAAVTGHLTDVRQLVSPGATPDAR